MINLSLGGVRDPLNPRLDTYSPLEQAAVEYAYSKGVVVVAAVGNGPQSPATPWGFAHYPASLPHVIGVSAVRQDGSVPDYSNRDAVYNDIAAPGDAIFSTIPASLVDTARPGCAGQAYSDCGPFEFRDAIGTSFAAPQVSAAAALLLGQDPTLRPEQVSWLLERSADDANAATGCATVPARPRPLHRLGNARRAERADAARRRHDAAAAPTTTSRTTTPAPGRTRCRRSRGRSARRSTSGTTTSTSTACT